MFHYPKQNGSPFCKKNRPFYFYFFIGGGVGGGEKDRGAEGKEERGLCLFWANPHPFSAIFVWLTNKINEWQSTNYIPKEYL